MFFAPDEVHKKVDHFAHNPGEIHSRDVVRWTLSETVKATQHSAALWAEQGKSYIKRQDSWIKYNHGSITEKVFLETVQEEEGMTPGCNSFRAALTL